MVELLIALGILVLAVLLILPGLQLMKTRADQISCLDRMHHLGFATMKFAEDHEGRFPAAGPDHPSLVASYLGGPDVVNAYRRCPRLKEGVAGSGEGSNGVIDYSFNRVYAETEMEKAPRESVYANPAGETIGALITPLIVEEDPSTMNRGDVETVFEGEDRCGGWHDGAMNYVAVDGSGRTVAWDPGHPVPRAMDFRVKLPAAE